MATKLNLAKLVEQLPDTDREVEFKLASEKVLNEKQTSNAPAATPPKPPKKGEGSKFTGPSPDTADKLCEEILAGGAETVRELVGMIRDPASDEFTNYKPEYLVHCLTVYLGRPGQEPRRRWFIDTLVAQVSSDQISEHVRGFLIRELFWVADQSAVQALGKFLAQEMYCDDAARALIAIGEGAAEQFRKALIGATGKRRLMLVQSLGAVRDAQSIPALRKALEDEDRDVRLAAAWGLARIGDASSVDLLLKAADAQPTWERIKATQSCLVLAETLAAAGKRDAAVKIYKHLRDTRTDHSEYYIRYVAEKALQS